MTGHVRPRRVRVKMTDNDAHTLDGFKCAFSGTLVSEQFGCSCARAVVRRGGPEIACGGADEHMRCAKLFDCLKSASLPAFGVPDDPLQMPHSVLLKVQFGGLAGIQRLLGTSTDDIVRDINALVADAVEKFGGLDQVPCADLVEGIVTCTIRRRRAR